MRPRAGRAFTIAILLLLAGAGPAWSDSPVPRNILEPRTAAETWNVIRLATQNVERLIAEKRLSEIPVQISYCSPALRNLMLSVNGEEAIVQVGNQTKQGLGLVNSIARAAQANDLETAREGLANLRTVLAATARHFDPATVAADIFSCPMHAEIISEIAQTPCARCGIRLLPRRIPYSFVYAEPGKPTVRLTASLSAPIEAGRKIEVKLRLVKADGSPVPQTDLLEMHAARLHLLIEEPGLGDYHHEHPTPTPTPGEYVFSFTPKKTAPYRIWADIIPLATGVQELPFVDLPSAGKGVPVSATGDRYTSVAGGYQFVLTFPRTEKLPLTAQQIRNVAITITDAAGRPATNLEPVMNAYAHLVGFHGDYQTIVHLHPRGGEILNPALRGGPSLGFDFFPPKTGFIRLYCQVRIDGQMLFAPFDLNVEPYCAPPAVK